MLFALRLAGADFLESAALQPMKRLPNNANSGCAAATNV
jgi:hypothetical protein